jgi:hypothetical protein
VVGNSFIPASFSISQRCFPINSGRDFSNFSPNVLIASDSVNSVAALVFSFPLKDRSERTRAFSAERYYLGSEKSTALEAVKIESKIELTTSGSISA